MRLPNIFSFILLKSGDSVVRKNQSADCTCRLTCPPGDPRRIPGGKKKTPRVAGCKKTGFYYSPSL